MLVDQALKWEKWWFASTKTDVNVQQYILKIFDSVIHQKRLKTTTITATQKNVPFFQPEIELSSSLCSSLDKEYETIRH